MAAGRNDRIISTGPADAETVVTGEGGRTTEHTWLLEVEERRRALDVHGVIAEAYAQAAAADEVYRRRILAHSFDLWAEKFAGGDEGGW